MAYHAVILLTLTKQESQMAHIVRILMSFLKATINTGPQGTTQFCLGELNTVSKKVMSLPT